MSAHLSVLCFHKHLVIEQVVQISRRHNKVTLISKLLWGLGVLVPHVGAPLFILPSSDGDSTLSRGANWKINWNVCERLFYQHARTSALKTDQDLLGENKTADCFDAYLHRSLTNIDYCFIPSHLSHYLSRLNWMQDRTFDSERPCY